MSSSGYGDYKDLVVWQKGIRLVRCIYTLTAKFPAEEKFRLISQMRRAAVSVPSNIAEGQARNSVAEFVHFISYSEGSVAELDTQLIVAIDLGFLLNENAQEAFSLILELRKMLSALRLKLEGKVRR